MVVMDKAPNKWNAQTESSNHAERVNRSPKLPLFLPPPAGCGSSRGEQECLIKGATFPLRPVPYVALRQDLHSFATQ